MNLRSTGGPYVPGLGSRAQARPAAGVPPLNRVHECTFVPACCFPAYPFSFSRDLPKPSLRAVKPVEGQSAKAEPRRGSYRKKTKLSANYGGARLEQSCSGRGGVFHKTTASPLFSIHARARTRVQSPRLGPRVEIKSPERVEKNRRIHGSLKVSTCMLLTTG